MCFYCHKLYLFPYAPSHGHDTCPELAKLKELAKKINEPTKPIKQINNNKQ